MDGTVNFNDVSRGIVIGFCLGLLWAAEEVLVGSDVISSIERRASAGLLCGRLVLIERRASGCSRTCAAASTPCCCSLDKRRGGHVESSSAPLVRLGAEKAGLSSIESRDR